jgi:hypothetical protein
MRSFSLLRPSSIPILHRRGHDKIHHSVASPIQTGAIAGGTELAAWRYRSWTRQRRIPPGCTITYRMYDSLLGGKDNFAADRAVADALSEEFPEIAANDGES